MAKIKAVDENENILKLSRAYVFEGETIDELDFSGFDDMGIEDVIEANDVLTKSGRIVPNPEMDAQYCLYIAAGATRRPHEFFAQLKMRDIAKVKNKVRNLFFGAE